MLANALPWRRPSRRDRFVASLRELSRRNLRSRRALATAGGAVAGVALLTVAGRRRLWQALGLAASAVEEVADTIEDAAEDLGDAARERAAGDDGD